jgi:O-antigen/teichoic acid export membrane protein
MVLTTPAGLRFQVVTTGLMCLTNVILTVLLVQRFGMAGAVWASVIALVVMHAVPIAFRARATLSH